MSARYRVILGIDYGKGRRAEPGEIVDDLPYGQIHNLQALGAIERAGNDDAEAAATEPVETVFKAGPEAAIDSDEEEKHGETSIPMRADLSTTVEVPDSIDRVDEEGE